MDETSATPPDWTTRASAARLLRRRQAMAPHDLGHLGSVRRATSGRVDHRGGLAEILWADRRGRDGTQGLHVLPAVVVESVNGAAWNAEGLPGPDVDPFAIDGPRQHPLDAVDGFFVVIVTVRRRRQPLRGRDRELEHRDAATGVVSRDQEAHAEWPDMNGLVGGIDVDVGGLRRH